MKGLQVLAKLGLHIRKLQLPIPQFEQYIMSLCNHFGGCIARIDRVGFCKNGTQWFNDFVTMTVSARVLDLHMQFVQAGESRVVHHGDDSIPTELVRDDNV